MTNETQETPKSDNAEEAQQVSEAVRAAVESGNDVAERVRQMVVGLFRGKQAGTATAQ